MSADGADALLAHDTLDKSAQDVRLQKERGRNLQWPASPERGFSIHIRNHGPHKAAAFQRVKTSGLLTLL